MLSKAEETILLVVLKLKDNAYGVSIRDQIRHDTGKTWSFSMIYRPLDKLAKKGLVIKTEGEPTPERGGRSKFYYTVTGEGRKTLIRLLKEQRRLWTGTAGILLEHTP